MLVTPDSAPAIGSIADLGELTWLRTTPGSTGDHVMRRITKALPATHWAPHTYTTYDVARALVRARVGSTVLPAMALSGANFEGMRVTPLPTLGTRQILLRRKNHGWDEAGAAARVAAHLLEWTRHHDSTLTE